MGTVLFIGILAVTIWILYAAFVGGIVEAENDTNRLLGVVFFVGLIVVFITAFMGG